LGAVGTLLKKNVFFETASPSLDYIYSLINTIYSWNYNIIFVYPYIDKINGQEICDRSYSRGITEGRFVPCDKILGLITACFEGYKKNVINKLNTNSYINKFGNNKNLGILRYNAKITPDDFAKINNNDFTSVDKYIFDKVIKVSKPEGSAADFNQFIVEKINDDAK